MTHDEFYKMRLGEVLDLIIIRNKQENLQIEMIGNVCATIANFSMGKKNKKYKSSDFFKIKKKQKRQNADEMVNILSAFTLSMEGEVNL